MFPGTWMDSADCDALVFDLFVAGWRTLILKDLTNK
jgi:hypothetical protein